MRRLNPIDGDRVTAGEPSLVVVDADEWEVMLAEAVTTQLGLPVRWSHYERPTRRMFFAVRKEEP